MEKNNNERNIELRSERVRNIIGQIPPVLLRYGAAIIGAAILAMVSISAFIPYREGINVEVTIKTTPQIQEITAQMEGLFLPIDTTVQSVQAGDTVGCLYHCDTLSPVISPISGKVIFNVASREAVNIGSLICIVIPCDSLCYYGVAEISGSDKARISVSSKVILQTSATDDIIGHINEISPIALTGNRYKVVVGLDYASDSLTPYEKLNGMVIISQTTILNRFLNSLKLKQ